MSLLMEALKKAELAKKSGFSASAKSGNAALAPEPGLTLAPQESPVMAPVTELLQAEQVRPLDPAADYPSIFTLDDEPIRDRKHLVQPPQARPARPVPPALDATPAPRPVPRPIMPESSAAQAKHATADIGAGQEKAKVLFGAKSPKPKRRTAIITIAGVTLLCVVVGGAYLYLAINQGTTGVILGNPQAVAMPATPAPALQSVVANLPSASIRDPVDLDATRAAATPELPPMPAPARPKLGGRGASGFNMAKAPLAPKRPIRSAVMPATVLAEAGAVQFRPSTHSEPILSSLDSAYRAFAAGDLGAAEQHYQQALRQDPNSRDALMGLAAITMNKKQFGAASSYYLKMLELDPNDADAIAALTSMQRSDPEQSMSRLKKILAQNPDSGPVLFVLGNMYAQQSRWADAQQSYFRAFGTAPGNADYAFNLAVSLDRLNQPRLALEYYERALAASISRPGNFNHATVKARVSQLQPAPR